MEKIKLTKREYLGEGTVIQTIGGYEKQIGITGNDYSKIVGFISGYTGQIFDTETGQLNENDYSIVDNIVIRAYPKFGAGMFYEEIKEKEKSNYIWQ